MVKRDIVWQIYFPASGASGIGSLIVWYISLNRLSSNGARKKEEKVSTNRNDDDLMLHSTDMPPRLAF